MKICKKCKVSLKGRRKTLIGHGEYLCGDCHSLKIEKSNNTPSVFKDTISGRQVKVIARPNKIAQKVKVLPSPIIVVNKTDDTQKLLKKSSLKKDKPLTGPVIELNAPLT